MVSDLKPWVYSEFFLTVPRILPIPHTRLRRRPLLTSEELQTGEILGHQSNVHPRRCQSQFSLETGPSIRQSRRDNHARTVSGSKEGQGRQGEPEAYQQMEAFAIDDGGFANDGKSISAYGQSENHEGTSLFLGT